MGKELILVVDDDKDIRDLIEIYLKNEGYIVKTAADGIEAVESISLNDVSLVILDVMMPRMNGIQACMKIRECKRNTMPIIMLSAKSEDTDKILGLGTGADDYITKPFNPLELIARVKSQLRRINQFSVSVNEASITSEINVGGLKINLDNHEVTINGVSVKLTPREFDILVLLSKNRGMVFSMQKIYEEIWNESYFISDSTVAVHIKNLREKLDAAATGEKYIKTVWGVGYKVEN
jgi:two-component system, OmpR family, response regulator VanR